MKRILAGLVRCRLVALSVLPRLSEYFHDSSALCRLLLLSVTARLAASGAAHVGTMVEEKSDGGGMAVTRREQQRLGRQVTSECKFNISNEQQRLGRQVISQ